MQKPIEARSPAFASMRDGFVHSFSVRETADDAWLALSKWSGLSQRELEARGYHVVRVRITVEDRSDAA